MELNASSLTYQVATGKTTVPSLFGQLPWAHMTKEEFTEYKKAFSAVWR
jgi:hypothetical protein